MAVDLNKSHYDKHGNKIPRSVTPENTAEEIYPGRKSPEESEGTYENNKSSSSDEKPFSFSDEFGNDMKELGKTMGELGKNIGELAGKYGENFGETMGELGENIGETMGKYGEKFGEQIGENMKKIFSAENTAAKYNSPKKFETQGQNYPSPEISSNAPAVKEKKKHHGFGIALAAIIILCVVFFPAVKGYLTAYYEDNGTAVSDYFSVNAPDELTVSCDNTTIYIEPSENDTVNVSYNLINAELVTSTTTVRNNVSTKFYTEKNDNVKKNPFLGTSGEITVYLPADFSGTLNIEGKNSPVYADSISVNGNITVSNKNSEINISNTKNIESLICTNKNAEINIENISAYSLDVNGENGTVNVKDSVFSGNTVIESDNGSINVASSTFSGDSKLIADNGKCVFDGAALENADVKCDNGSIKGTLDGKKSDYKIKASADNGTSNISDTNSGKYILNLDADNGSIDLDFE